MATTTLTGTQSLPYCSGRIDTITNTARVVFRIPGSGMRFLVTGTDCTLTGTWSTTQPMLLFIDGVAQTTPTHASGVLTLFTGLSDTQRTVELRLVSGAAGTGNYLTAASTALTVTGAAPAVVADTTWGPQRPCFAGAGILTTLLPDVTTDLIGPVHGTTAFPSAPATTSSAMAGATVRFRARADRIYVSTVTAGRWFALYRDGVRVASISSVIANGNVYQWQLLASGQDDGAEHEWMIVAGAAGTGTQTLDMVMIGGANAAFSTTNPADRPCILALGDSLTAGVSGGGTDDTQGDTSYAYGSVLGRLMGRDGICIGRAGSVVAVGAQQIASDLRLAMAATGKCPTHLVILYGRNNSDTPTTQADFATMLNQALAVPQFTGRIVVVTVPQIGSWAGTGALVNAGIRNAVTAVNSNRVTLVEGAGWTDIPVGTGDNTHYTITGQSLLAQRLYDSGAMADPVVGKVLGA